MHDMEKVDGGGERERDRFSPSSITLELGNHLLKWLTNTFRRNERKGFFYAVPNLSAEDTAAMGCGDGHRRT